MIFRSKYLRNMQQGGGLSVFAPNPQPYRAPLQGLNPNVFQYDVRTQPIDISNLIQVMQTKDAMDIMREQAALERQKLKAEVDLANMKFEHQKAKAQMDFSLDIMDKFGGFNKPIPFEDYTMSNRYKAQYEPLVNDFHLKQEELFKMIATTPMEDRLFPSKLQNKLDAIDTAYKRIIPLEEFKMDQAGRDKIAKIQSNPSGDLQVYSPSLLRLEDKRQRFYNGMEDNGYNMGYVTDPTIWYSQKTEAEKLKEAFRVLNTPQPITSFNTDPSGENDFNQYIQVDNKNYVLKADEAAKIMAKKILADPKQSSYVSNLYGIDLHDPNVSTEDKVNILQSVLKPQLEYDDALLSSKKESYRITQTTPKPDRDINMNYNVSGGRHDTKSFEGVASFNYNGTGNKAGASKKEKDKFNDQVNAVAKEIIIDNNEANKNNQDAINDAVKRFMVKYPNITEYLSDADLKLAWSDALQEYRSLPSDSKNARAFDGKIEYVLKTYYDINLADVGKEAADKDEYYKLAKKLTANSKWEDLKTSNSSIVKDKKGNLLPDSQLKLIFEVVKNTAANINAQNLDFNAARPSIKSQLQGQQAQSTSSRWSSFKASDIRK